MLTSGSANGKFCQLALLRLTRPSATHLCPILNTAGMSEVDEFATRYQRGIAAAVQALGLIAQRVSPAAADSGIVNMQKQICALLLPLTMDIEPVERLPPGAVKPAQAAYWVTEGAAFALLMLCEGPGAAAGANGTAAGVAPSMPAHHSDPRYAYGMCLLALRRAESTAQRRDKGSDVLLNAMHAVGAAERWRQLYAAASVSSQLRSLFLWAKVAAITRVLV